ncbi:exonuclease domain-containing protein [Enterococcus faecalis]|uniref:exonuclease domain-containing protein n=1 Tax=Enterococcus faecalis TaxID=1351 RepID=UPI002263DF08|nr:exonuclease domain-containing protein [Enterococcus faecalis]
MNFYAFDFETASYDKHSACSIAIVKVENSRIVDEFYTLIKPETPFFWRNTQIHGIHESDVVNAPKFPEVWQNSALFSAKSVSGRSQCKF